MKKTDKWSEFLFDTRLGAAVLYVMMAVGISVFFGGVSAVFMQRSFLYCSEVVFVVFGGAFVVTAVLIVFTRIEEGLAGGFGVALYWGTGIVAGLLEGTIYDTGSRLFISFVLCSLVCYITYNQCFKN